MALKTLRMLNDERGAPPGVWSIDDCDYSTSRGTYNAFTHMTTLNSDEKKKILWNNTQHRTNLIKLDLYTWWLIDFRTSTRTFEPVGLPVLLFLTPSSSSSLEYHLSSSFSVTVVQINLFAVEFIYLATSAKCVGPINRPTAVKGLDFMKIIIIMMISQYFCIFFWFLNKAYQILLPCSYCSTGQRANKHCLHPKTAQLLSQQTWQALSTKNPKF